MHLLRAVLGAVLRCVAQLSELRSQKDSLDMVLKQSVDHNPNFGEASEWGQQLRQPYINYAIERQSPEISNSMLRRMRRKNGRKSPGLPVHSVVCYMALI